MKRGFYNLFKTYYSLVKLRSLDSFEPGDRVTPEVLFERGILRNLKLPVKILGDGEISKALNVTAHKFTRSAREKIEAAHGTAEELQVR
jgi:large subunit ribosomal protein L15